MKKVPLTIILANGSFPQRESIHNLFLEADHLVCCDGAAENAITNGRIPDVIVGDLDSLSERTKQCYHDRLVYCSEQETNDLSKAFRYCLARGWNNIKIIGATGKREDHTLGNIARLVDFAQEVDTIEILTDTGVFRPITKPGRFLSHKGSQISIFSFDPNQEITSYGLKYPLKKLRLQRWYTATLNEALEDSFTLEFTPTLPILIFSTY